MGMEVARGLATGLSERRAAGAACRSLTLNRLLTHLSGQGGQRGFAAYEDGFTALELTRQYYREAGLDTRQLDLLVR